MFESTFSRFDLQNKCMIRTSISYPLEGTIRDARAKYARLSYNDNRTWFFVYSIIMMKTIKN